MNNNKNFRISQAGQSLVEFALILPMMMLFLMVIFDLGRAAYIYSAIHNAAREGARYGAVRWYDADRTTKTREAVERLTAGLNAAALNVSSVFVDLDAAVDSNGDGNNSNDPDALRVTVSYNFQTATPILAQLLGSGTNSITLSSQATMQTER